MDAITTIDGSHLSIDDVFDISCKGKQLTMSQDPQFLGMLQSSIDVVRKVLENGTVIYGINTNFGGLASSSVSAEQAALLQENLIWGLKCSIGYELPARYIRAAMLIRANTLCKGASGIRPEIIERLVAFLNADITPIVRDLGSIGASGDLVPLAHIAGAVIGLDPGYKVRHNGIITDSVSALKSLGLEPLRLRPKEGLALVNGTSMLSGIAALVFKETKAAMDLALWINALFFHSLDASPDPFDPFVHQMKPHHGQKLVAETMRILFGADEEETIKDKRHHASDEALVQDRYSMRCIPQFYGPLIDGINDLERHVITEINSADDNPLVDIKNERLLQAGNFYGQYIGIGMDHLRQYVAMAVKQLEAQISLLVVPEFSKGLPASLAIEEQGIRFGLKGLQICGNSILPRLLHLANPVATLFPTHAEQFNQNINSQGFNSALFAAESMRLFKHHLAISLVFGVQSVELRARMKTGSFDGRTILSKYPAQLYELFYDLVGKKPDAAKPLVEKNYHVAIDEMLQKLIEDLKHPDGRLFALMERSGVTTLHWCNALAEASGEAATSSQIYDSRNMQEALKESALPYPPMAQKLQC